MFLCKLYTAISNNVVGWKVKAYAPRPICFFLSIWSFGTTKSTSGIIVFIHCFVPFSSSSLLSSHTVKKWNTSKVDWRVCFCFSPLLHGGKRLSHCLSFSMALALTARNYDSYLACMQDMRFHQACVAEVRKGQTTDERAKRGRIGRGSIAHFDFPPLLRPASVPG